MCCCLVQYILSAMPPFSVFKKTLQLIHSFFYYMLHKIVTLLIITLLYLIKMKLAPSMTISKCSKHYFFMKYPQQIHFV